MRKVANAKLVMRERVHQSKAKRVRQGQEDLHRLGGGLVRRKLGAQSRDLAPVNHLGKWLRLHS